MRHKKSIFSGLKKGLRLWWIRLILLVLLCTELSTLLALLPSSPTQAITTPTVSSYQTSIWTDVSSASEVTGTLTWSSGDLIVVVGATENGSLTLGTPTATGLTFSLVTSVNVGVGGDAPAYVWKATAGSSGSSAVTATAVGGAAARGIAAYAFSGSSGTGNTGTLTASTSKVVSLTRGTVNSAVVTVMGDWQAINDTSVTASPAGGTIRQADLSVAHAAFFVADWGDQGAVGTTSYGITDHTGTVRMSGIAVEVKGVPPPSLTLASSTSETQQTTTSATYVASDTTIASGSLPAGTYFVTWGAAVANSNNANITNVRLMRGATEIAALSSESMTATAANMGMGASGYWLGTLSGSEALTIEYNSSLATSTAYIDSKFIKAIRLDTHLTADSHYFTSGSQESATDEVTDAPLDVWTDVKTLTKTFNSVDQEEYLVFASMEVSPDNITNDCSGRIAVEGMGSSTSSLEGEDIADQHMYAAARIFTLGAGSKSIKLQGQSIGGATCDFRRSRIYVFRASVFDQAVENFSSGESTLASATWTDKNSQTYTPNQSETVMVIGSRLLNTTGVACPIATRLSDGTTQYADATSFVPNNVTDYASGMTAASQTVSAATTFKVQFQRVTSTCTVKIKESSLIIWSMTLRDAATYNQSGYRWFSNTVGTGASGTWWNTAWKNRRKITFNNSQSTENLVNFPARVSLTGGNSTSTSKNIDYAKTLGAGQDIRFVDADGTTLLKHEIEKWDETGTSEVWVKVPQIDSASTTDFIWMYYNNSSAPDGQDPTNVWDTNFKGVWHLKEDPTSATPAMKDSTASGYHGTSVSLEASDQVLGQVDGSLTFDGTDGAAGEMVDLGKQTNLFSSTAYTVSCWVNAITTVAGEKHFFSDVGAGATTASFDMYLSGATPVFLVNDAGTVGGAVGTADLVGGQWYLMTGVMTNVGDSATTTLYKNGQFDATATTAGAMPATNANAGKAGIAGPPDYTGPVHFPGTIDECRYSNTNRSAEWIEADYKTQNNQMNSFGAEEADANYTALAAANTAYTLTSDGQDFRLRLLLHTANNDLPTGSQSFKLQVAQKSGTCDTAYSGETYADVGTATGAIRYKDNTGETDGASMLSDADDPTHSADTVVPQTYEEANNFTNTARIGRGQDGKWEFALTDFSAPGSTAYCFRVVKSDGSAIATPGVVPEISTAGTSNTAPTNPGTLVQKKTDDTVIATGAWVNATSIKFTAVISDPDAGDTLQLCVEKDILGVTFSNTEDLCGTGVAYSGTPVAASVTITGLTDAQEYHWQARVKDAGGLYSGWVSYDVNLESARDFGLDTTAPTGGTVFDGTSVGVDATFNDGSLTTLSANWSGFNAAASGLLRYEYSIGTTAGATDTKAWTNNGTATSVTATGLTLKTSQLYFVNVRAVDNAGNVQTAVSSNGQMVAPNLSFTISPTTLTFANLNAANAYTDSKATTLTTSTNAFNGYVVRLAATDFLRSGSFTIPNFSGGTYALPDSWQSGDTGFGYTSSDTLVQGTNKFQSTTCPGGSALASPGCFAPYSQIKPGDIVADSTGPVTASPVTITHRVTTLSTQAAQRYAAVLIYAITALY